MRTRARRRRPLRTAALTVILAALALAAGAYVVGQLTEDEAAGDPAVPTTFSAYAAQVIDSTPGAFTSGQVVVVPGAGVGESEGTALPPERVGETVTLPARALEGVDEWRAPGAGEQPGPDQVGSLVADRGQALLACTEWPRTRGCTVSVGHLEDGDFVYDFGVGTDRFQAPGAEMEVFLIPSHSPAGPETLVLAGGADPATSAVVVLSDGTEVPATVTRALGRPTGAIYFARTAGTPVRVIAFGANGRALEDHALRPCRPGDSCEVQ